MKGISGIDLVFVGLIITSTLIMGMLAPLYFKIKLDEEATSDYGYYKAQNSLSAILSITHENKKVYELIAERFSVKEPSDLDFLKEKMKKLVGSECYELSVSKEKLIQKPSKCELKYSASAILVLPYHPLNLVERIEAGLE